MAFVAIKMGRRQGARSGAYLNGYVIDPAGAGQPPAHFHRNPPGRWLRRGGFFRVARSLRINSDMLLAPALKNSQLIPRPRDEGHVIYGTGHWV